MQSRQTLLATALVLAVVLVAAWVLREQERRSLQAAWDAAVAHGTREPAPPVVSGQTKTVQAIE